MKILFIGGNGNISWYCLSGAIDAGHEVYALNRGVTSHTRRSLPVKTIQITADIRNKVEVTSFLKDLTFDVVCDFICFNEDQARFDVDLFKNKTKQFIFISSESVYKRDINYLPFNETTPQNDITTSSSYISGKIEAERVFIDAYHKINFPVTIIRPSYTYDTIIPVSIGHNCFTAVQKFIDNKLVLIAGEGNNLRTFTHSKDFAAAFLGIIGNSDTIGEDYHITSDEHLSWLDVTHSILNVLNIKNSDYLHIPKEIILANRFLGQKDVIEQKLWHNIYDNTKIKKILPRWKAKLPFEMGIRETLNWLNEDSKRIRINSQLDQLIEQLTIQYYKGKTL